MNYLAHFQLASTLADKDSEAYQGLMIGALLGDFVKGPLRGDWPEHWERGIALHRRIDALTDGHPHTRNCLAALPAQYRRYGGIMLDVCFDHCLSNNWSTLHGEQAIGEFARHCYQIVLDQKAVLPSPARRQIDVLARYDVLSHLHDWHKIEGMLARIGQRIRRDNPLADCGDSLRGHSALIDREFCALYPALKARLRSEFALP